MNNEVRQQVLNDVRNVNPLIGLNDDDPDRAKYWFAVLYATGSDTIRS